MNGRGLVHALRSGAAWLRAEVSSADSWRLFGGEPTVTVSSVCRHVWFPSPGGPAEYCGRCGVVRPRTSGWADTEDLGGGPAPEPPRPVGPIGWPEADLPGPTAGAPAAYGPDVAVAFEAAPIEAAPIEAAPPTARPVGPRVTRPRRFPFPLLGSGLGNEDQGRSFTRTATMVAVFLSLAAVFGFVIADLTRESRDIRGVAAVSPTGTPLRSAVASSIGAAPTATPGPSAIEGPTPTTEPVVVGPPMAPPTVRLGDRLRTGGIDLRVAWKPPTDGSTGSRYDLRMTRDSSASQKVALEKQTSLTAQVAAAANHGYTFQLRARNKDGIEGPPATATVRLDRIEESAPAIRVSKGWKIAEYPSYTGAGARYSSTSGAELSLTFDGTGVALVGPVGPGRGRAEVLIDGERVGRFDAIGSTFEPTRLLFKADGLAARPHVLTVRVAGTSGRPIVAIDRFLVLGRP